MDDAAKTKQLLVRVSPREHEVLKQMAQDGHRTIAGQIRYLIYLAENERLAA